MLSLVEWSNNFGDVQSIWNDFETKIIKVIDELVPLTEFSNNIVIKEPSCQIKRKLLRWPFTMVGWRVTLLLP